MSVVFQHRCVQCNAMWGREHFEGRIDLDDDVWDAIPHVGCSGWVSLPHLLGQLDVGHLALVAFCLLRQALQQILPLASLNRRLLRDDKGALNCHDRLHHGLAAGK